MRNTLFVCVLGALTVCRAFAQDETRQAMITGRSGSPKCTIEVEVDAVADVEIRGTIGRIHTLAGSPSNWRRFECNVPMPINPANFRFRGIDGRGRQTLIGDPYRSGVAIVRIEDPKSGREGYTFDLEWEGSAGPIRAAGQRCHHLFHKGLPKAVIGIVIFASGVTSLFASVPMPRKTGCGMTAILILV